MLSPSLFNLYAEYIMQNARLDETQAGIKIVRRNINNLRYADDTTFMAESEEELKSLLDRSHSDWCEMVPHSGFDLHRCPSVDEWIRKLWYIYTMEYYSAIKKNTFESVLMGG